MADVQWNDSALKAFFKRLNGQLRDELATQDEPADSVEFKPVLWAAWKLHCYLLLHPKGSGLLVSMGALEARRMVILFLLISTFWLRSL